jgi:hypothetical protein
LVFDSVSTPLQIILNQVGYVGFGQNERLTRDANDTFVGAATGRWRQHPRCVGDVRADHGEIAVFKFPNVRTTDGAEAAWVTK